MTEAYSDVGHSPTSLVVATCNIAHEEKRPVLEAADKLGAGVLIKKGLMSGHVGGAAAVQAAFRHVFRQPGVSNMVVGKIDPAHLRANAATLDRVLADLG